jgi:hypothetical protein
MSASDQPVPIPTEADWQSEGWGIDTRASYKKFFGKTSEEAYRILANDALAWGEEVTDMPESVFHYYFPLYAEYLLSPESESDSDGASSFIGRAAHRASSIVSGGQAMISLSSLALARIANAQEWFDAKPEIYGSFRERVTAVWSEHPCLKPKGEQAAS